MTSLPPRIDDLLKTSDLPVLVDFYADWCSPCKVLSPVVAALAQEYKGRLVTIKINTDKKPELAARFEIQSIPTLMMFWKGKVLMRLSGAMPQAALKRELDLALGRKEQA